MKSVKSKAGGSPPDDGKPTEPPTSSISPDIQRTQSEPETEPRPGFNYRNVDLDYKGESGPTQAMPRPPTRRGGLYTELPGTGAVLCFMGHALMENRYGLIVQGDLTQAVGLLNERPDWTWFIAIPPFDKSADTLSRQGLRQCRFHR